MVEGPTAVWKTLCNLLLWIQGVPFIRSILTIHSWNNSRGYKEERKNQNISSQQSVSEPNKKKWRCHQWVWNLLTGDSEKTGCLDFSSLLIDLGAHRWVCLFHDWASVARSMEKEMATHSSILAWRISGTEEPGGLLSMGSHRVGDDWSDLAAAATWSTVLAWKLSLANFLPLKLR